MAKTPQPLDEYSRKRNFDATPEPGADNPPKRRRARAPASEHGLQYCIQKHDASHLHYDFRLELDGTLKSWAVPKGPSLDPSVRRLAIHVEDHPLDYASFEGHIPEGHYGGGDVIVWDRGIWSALDGDPQAAYAKGKLKFRLEGEKLGGVWNLVKTHLPGKKEQWFLIKHRDDQARPSSDYDILVDRPDSVLSDRTLPAKRPGKSAATAAAAKPAKTAKPAKPAKASAKASPDNQLRISHPERIIDASSGISKMEVAEYFARVAPWALPWLKDRPVALVRGPEGIAGELFFQKHSQRLKIPHIRQLDRALDPDHEPLMVIDSLQSLVGTAQMGTLELHTWNATAPQLEKPDRFVLDLDPDLALPWKSMVEATQLVLTLLDEIGLQAFIKTSGGKGLHVVVPLTRRQEWEPVKSFSQDIAQYLAALMPERFSAVSGPKNRHGKIYLDYLRNGRGASTVSPFSPRAREGLPVSVPLFREELAQLKGAGLWTVRNVFERLDELGNDDPWADFSRCRQSITAAMRKQVKAR